MKVKAVLVASFGALLLGCGAARPVVPTHHRSHSVQEQGDARIGGYISSEWSLQTASYWIEGPNGLVFIDTQLLPSALRKQMAFAKERTGKEVKLAIILHPTPDRFNGTALLKELGVPVLTSDQVRARIPAVHAKWAPSLFQKYWNGRYPRELVLADGFGDSTRELSAAGLTLKAHVLGAGCSPEHVVIEWEGHLFTGDLVARATHPWFEDGRVDAWLQRLDELRALKPKWIHPGRGLPGGPELLDAQAAYLQAVVEEVTAERRAAHPSSDPIATVIQEVTRRFPDHHLPTLLPALVKGEWARQAPRPSATPPP
ncbi:MBL fold metallo-hydrolase [Corallococcus sp. BB11-1]|uniref:MBL fold metallo-hydrolase n=1 Tax=Corallococcus sp. BB11-1 TaxID=2996783 RepID=UPI002271DEFC|nr:MBL fold metallo-hydrolase [Corallococcus sp. BB11-1]MCY1035100.1 MBL fold metallo-hydrolase [Corallococcus sp. BB11-1]